MTAAARITELYISYYDRAPDPAGLAYWVERYDDGMSLLEIANSFAVQNETLSKYPYLADQSTGSVESFVTSVYQNLFGRDPDQAGLNYWVQQIEGGQPLGRIIVDIVSGAQGTDAIIIQNQVSVGLYYADALVEHAQHGHVKEWSPESAVAVLDEVNADPATVVDGYAEVDAYIHGTDPTDPAPGNLIDAIGDLVEDVGQVVINPLDNLLGGVLGPVLNLVDGILDPITGTLEDTVTRIVNFDQNGINIDLSELNLDRLGPIDAIADLGPIADLTVLDVFQDSPLARVQVGGESLLLVDVNLDGEFKGGEDLQLLGLSTARLEDFIL